MNVFEFQGEFFRADQIRAAVIDGYHQFMVLFIGLENDTHVRFSCASAAIAKDMAARFALAWRMSLLPESAAPAPSTKADLLEEIGLSNRERVIFEQFKREACFQLDADLLRLIVSAALDKKLPDLEPTEKGNR